MVDISIAFVKCEDTGLFKAFFHSVFARSFIPKQSHLFAVFYLYLPPRVAVLDIQAAAKEFNIHSSRIWRIQGRMKEEF